MSYSTTQTGISASGNSGAQTFSGPGAKTIDINLSSFTGTAIVFTVRRINNFGDLYPVWAYAATSAGLITAPLETDAPIGSAQIDWYCVGVTSATFTLSAQ